MKVDQTSLMLGRLETAMNTHTTILQKMDDKLTLMNGSVKASHMRIDYLEPQLDEAIKNGEDWIKTRAGAKWLFAGMTIAGSGIGAAISGVAAKIFGEGG